MTTPTTTQSKVPQSEEIATQSSTQATSQSSTHGQRLRWTDVMEDTLLEFLRQEVNLGKRADNSFKKKTWEDGVVAIRAVTSEVVILDLWNM